MANSNPQLNEFKLVTGALGYRSRSDITATPEQYLVSGSQNVLINEATDRDGDKVETRAGYEIFANRRSGYEIVTAQAREDFSIDEASIESMWFSPDGLNFYTLETSASPDIVSWYTLGTAWNVGTRSLVGTYNLVSGAFFEAICMSYDGTKLYAMRNNETLYQYALSTAWDITTATLQLSQSFSGDDASMYGIYISNNGKYLYINGATNEKFFQYTLATAWNISTASLTNSISYSAVTSAADGIHMSPDGTRLYVAAFETRGTVYQWNLSTAFDITTATFAGVYEITDVATSGTYSVFVGDGGNKMYVGESVDNFLYQFTLNDNARNKIVSADTFKTKAGNTMFWRFTADGILQFLNPVNNRFETLLTGLDGDYPFRTTTAHNGTELLRVLLGVNHSSTLYEWSGAYGTLLSVSATEIVLNETIATQGFLTTGTRKIRIKDVTETWREATISSQSGSTFTVSTDLSAYTFDTGTCVVQSVRENTNEPASGYVADTIKTLQNHVYIGSHSSSVVYMSKSTDYTDFSFSSPRLPTEGWQFVLDSFNVGFETNIGGNGLESLIMFADNDWVYRVEFEQHGDASILETAKIKPILVSSGQGAVRQELIAKMGNSVVYLNRNEELVELGQLENYSALAQIPLSDPIKPDFIAADFTNGYMRFYKNNLYVTAPASSKMFILSFREGVNGSRRFWQPPQILPVGVLTDYNNTLVGHSSAVTESYTLFTGVNDDGQPISFKAHFAYRNDGARDKLKNFNTYFTEMYLTANAEVNHTILFEYLGSRNIVLNTYTGQETNFMFIPNETASIGVSALGTTPLGGQLSEPENLRKYRRFKRMVPVDYFEYQVRYEMDAQDAQFQILSHGSNADVSAASPQKLVD